MFYISLFCSTGTNPPSVFASPPTPLLALSDLGVCNRWRVFGLTRGRHPQAPTWRPTDADQQQQQRISPTDERPRR